MGCWGTGIMQDDTILDIIEDFKDYLKETQNVEESSKKLIANNKELIEDEDLGPLFWIALAKCQWEYGKLDTEVHNKIINDYKEEKGLDLWKEQSEKEYLKRKKVISEFISKIEQTNNNVKKIPKKVVRKPIFEEGDCLSLKINDYYYGAAIVVKSDDSDDEYGANLIVALDYWEKREPVLKDFQKARFLTPTFGVWKGKMFKSWYLCVGFRKYKDKIIKVSNINITKYRDLDSSYHAGWGALLYIIELQKAGKDSLNK